MNSVLDLNDRVALWEAGQADRATPVSFASENNVVRLWGACPWADHVTPYDTANIYIYNWLLNGEYEGASEREMADTVFGLDVDKEPSRARMIVRTHLERAHWLQHSAIPYLNW